MVSHSEDAELAAYLYVGSVALPGLIVFSFVISRFGFDWSSFRPRKGLDALIKSTPIGIATLLSQYSMFAATMMVGYFLSKEDLGFFTAAHRIVIFLWAYIISSQQRILLPSLSKSFHESLPQFREFVEKFFRLSALAAVPIGLIGTVCSTALMMLLYSARYEASGVVFGILLWGFVFANIRSILETALIASDRQMRLLKGMAFLSIMYTIMTPILTLQFGIIGTAIAVVVSELSYFTYLIFSSPYSKPVSLLKGFWKPLLAALIAMITLLPLIELSLVLRVVLGSTVFGIIVVALKGVTRDDFKVITFLFRRNNLEPST
jgi:O-antigen/teichoic acid export membrane protein